MTAGWMFLMLLGCGLSGATHESHSTCPCNVQRTVCGEAVRVPCPNMTEAQTTFNLFQDQELISNFTCARTDESDTLKCTPLNARAGVGMDSRKGHKSVDFVLAGVNKSSHGTYRCEGIIMFPPPLRRVPSVVMIHVLGEAHPCKSYTNSSNHGDTPSQRYDWIWILIVALLSIYSVVVTIIAVVHWVMMRSLDSQSDYMNTKPRGQNDRRKKRGVQKPTPRHF